MLAICSIMKPQSGTIKFDLVNVQSQPNGSDCGLFAIAFATELIHGNDPFRCHFDVSSLRGHLLDCLENGKIQVHKHKKNYPRECD